MINEESLNKMYEELINSNLLTTQKLRDCGFNNNDLNLFVKYKQLEKVKRGQYDLKYIEEFIMYGKELVESNEYDKAIFCFDKCYQINSNHVENCLYLFLCLIKMENYTKAFEVLDSLYQIIDDSYLNELNHYLFLLSNITDVPSKYVVYIQSLIYNDLRKEVVLEDGSLKKYNNIRKVSIKKRFSYALKQLKDLMDHQENNTIHDLILEELLEKAQKQENFNREKIISLIQKKDYESIITFLSEIQQRTQLSLSEKYVLLLAKQIIDIRLTSKIPVKKINIACNLFQEIDNGNYENALAMITVNNQKNNINNKDSYLFLLLKEISLLIRNLSKEGIEQVSNFSQQIGNESCTNLIKQKYNQLVKEQGIVLLKNMSDEQIKEVISIIKKYSDLDYLVITTADQKKRVMLRYKTSYNKSLNIQELIKQGQDAYAERKYEKSIELFIETMRSKQYISAIIYGMIGLSYFKLGKNEKALDYLEVANFLAKGENNNLDYTEILLKLKGQFKLSNVKPKIDMDIQEFGSADVLDNYGITNFDEINNYILSNKTSIDIACRYFNMSEEQVSLVKLIYARDYYLQGDLKQGNLFLENVQKSKNKTLRIKSIINFLLTNRRFLKNRQLKRTEKNKKITL